MKPPYTCVALPFHWLSVCYRNDFRIMLLMFKSLIGLALLYVHTPAKELRLANQLLLDVPWLKTRYPAFTITTPNGLLFHIRSASTLEHFKSLLKTHFLLLLLSSPQNLLLIV